MKILLLLIVLVSGTTTSYAQLDVTQESHQLHVSNQFLFEGIFSYTISSQNYQVQLSLEQGLYTELDESGTILSNGIFEKVGDNVFRLIPTEVFDNGRIIEPLYYFVKSRHGNSVVLALFSEELNSMGEIAISRI